MAETLDRLAAYCSEFLVHAADVEGLCGGIDSDLVRALGAWSTIPVTYAGGACSIDDLERVRALSGGRVDLTFGSALDIFGGNKVRFEDCVRWNRTISATASSFFFSFVSFLCLFLLFYYPGPLRGLRALEPLYLLCHDFLFSFSFVSFLCFFLLFYFLKGEMGASS